MNWKVLKEKSDPFFVSDKKELIKEAYIGTISPMDLVQNQNTEAWFYAYEIDELLFQPTLSRPRANRRVIEKTFYFSYTTTWQHLNVWYCVELLSTNSSTRRIVALPI